MNRNDTPDSLESHPNDEYHLLVSTGRSAYLPLVMVLRGLQKKNQDNPLAQQVADSVLRVMPDVLLRASSRNMAEYFNSAQYAGIVTMYGDGSGRRVQLNKDWNRFRGFP